MIAYHGQQAVKDKPRHLSVAANSVALVKAYFEARGFAVYDICDPCANGQDMTVAKAGRTLRVEVKTVVPGTRAWRIKPVKPLRQKDDLIALVIKSRVFVQPMRDHLACCSDDGSRSVTDLVKLIELLEQAPGPSGGT